MASHAERLKTHHASVIRTLHSEIRRYPGGFVELARQTGRAVQTLINQFGPNSLDHAPTADLFLDVIEIIPARATVGVIAGAVEMMAVDATPFPPLHEDDAGAFRRVVGEAGDVLAAGALHLADNRFDAAERVAMAAELDDLITAADALRRRLRR